MSSEGLFRKLRGKVLAAGRTASNLTWEEDQRVQGSKR